MPLDGKTPAESKTTLSQVMFPEHANIFNTVHGGEILKMMDTASGVCASRHIGGPVNTKAIGGFVFHAPVPVNQLCTCNAHITSASEKVMEIFTEFYVESHDHTEATLCATGYFYYVGLDLASWKPVPARPVICTSPEEEAAFAAGKKRMAMNLELAKF